MVVLVLVLVLVPVLVLDLKLLPLLQVLLRLKVLALRRSLFELRLMEAGLLERLWRLWRRQMQLLCELLQQVGILSAELRLVGRTKDRSVDAA
jgi:hypothetical protein